MALLHFSGLILGLTSCRIQVSTSKKPLFFYVNLAKVISFMKGLL